MDEMKRIVICKHCEMPEYYGEMRWLSGICYCRNCYKGQYERERHEIYKCDDLDGKRPTMEEDIEQVMNETEILKEIGELKRCGKLESLMMTKVN